MAKTSARLQRDARVCRIDGPATTLVALVGRVAHQRPGAAALLVPGGVVGTYSDLAHQIAAVGAALGAAGVTRADRIAVALPSGPEMAVAFLGVAGVASCAPLNPNYTRDEATFHLSDLDVRALIVPAGADVPAREAALVLGVPCLELAVEPGAPSGTFSLTGLPIGGDGPSPPAPDDVALVLHTSGTTARPKQVLLTHANLCASAGNVAVTLQLSAADRCLNVMPLFHIHGLIAALTGSLAVGASVICAGAFDPELFLTWLVDGEATWYTAVPTVHQAVLTAAARDPEKAARARLRLIRSSSAPLPPQVMAKLETRFGVPVIEAYGMTEAAHQMTSNPLPPAERRPGTVGLPAGPEVAIVDAEGRRLEAGQVGEIVVRGTNVISEYAANPEANTGAFVNGWFRTGDQGVLDPDGYLTITGRLKELINRGGEKIAPREVDEALLAHPTVASALAFAVPHPTLGEDVAAAVVAAPGATVDPRQLRLFLADRLVPYKVPRRIVVVDQLPHGPTGKPTRIGLADRLGLGSTVPPRSGDEPASSALEAALAALWAPLLGIAQVPRDEDFVALGGDSLSAIQLLAQVRDAFAVEVPLGAFFDDGATVRGMAALIERLRAQGAPAPTHAVEAIQQTDALSFAQERLWFLDALEGGGMVAYNAALALRLRGALDPTALTAAVDTLAARHDALRTTFPTGSDGRPRSIVHPPRPVTIVVESLEGLSPESPEQADRARLRAEQEVATPFDLAAAPCFRALLVRLGPEDHLLVLVVHHIVIDGWSRRILRRELAALYRAGVKGEDVMLPPLPVSYGALAAWQRHRMSDPDTAAGLLQWWRDRLTDLPGPLDLPTDRRRPRRQDYAGGTLRVRVSPSLWDQIASLARSEGATPFMVLLSGLFALLRRYTGGDELTVGIPVLGRNSTDTQRVVGLFADTVVVRSRLEGDPSFRQLLGEVREASIGAIEHAAAPFELVVDAVAPERSPAHPPLFQVLFQLRNNPDAPDEDDGLVIEEVALDASGAKFDLEFDLQPHPGGGLDVKVVYAAALFDSDTVERMAGHYASVLESAAMSPDARLSELDLLKGDERSRGVTLRGDALPGSQPEVSVHELVAAQAAETPDAVAVRCGHKSLSYAELAWRAGCLAEELAAAGIGCGDTVAVLAARSEEMVVALLGVLWSGASYVPLDPELPPARLTAMLEQSGAAALVCDAPSASYGADLGVRMIHLGSPPPGRTSRPPAAVGPDDVAYVMFTSGSTGIPKGVVVEHRSVVNLLRSMARRPGFGPGQTLLALTTSSFDMSVPELFLPLTRGGTVEVATDDAKRDPWQLAKLIGERRVDVLQATPSTWQMLLDAGWEGDPELVAVCGAEALTTELAQALGPKVGELWNGYGPTETTVWASMHLVDPDDDPVPLGSPVDNTLLTVRDRHLRRAPIGVRGELLIGGAGLARGYLGEAELTAERFVDDPEGEGRLYRTGDLVRQRADGSLVYLGRIDHQVKVRGFRVELGDVEHAVTSHPAVTRAVVTLQGEGKDAALVAYVQSAESPDTTELRRHVAARVPDYMVPASFIEVPALPLTPSGKIDRRRLPPSPQLDARQRRAPPSTPTEQRLAELWRDLIGLACLPARDDAFFEVGGHSLLAVELFVQIERRLGADLPLAQIFDTPTLAGLAEVIDDAEPDRTRAAGRTAVLMAKGPTEAPTVVWVPGGGGSTIELSRLAGEMEGRLTFYGLEAPGHRPGERPCRTVEKLVQVHLASVGRLGVPRRHVVGGNSFGGLVAFELAAALEASGAPPEELVIVDTWGPLQVARHLHLNWKGRALESLLPWLNRVTRERRLRPSAADRLERVMRRSRMAVASYEPTRRYHGHVCLLTTRARVDECGDPLLGWGDHLLGPVDRVMLPGEHGDLVRRFPEQIAGAALKLVGARAPVRPQGFEP